MWAGLFLLTTVLLLLGLVGLYSYQSEAAGVLELAGFLAAFLGTALAFAPPGVQPAVVGAVRIALGVSRCSSSRLCAVSCVVVWAGLLWPRPRRRSG